jgi:hypothetical protein
MKWIALIFGALGTFPLGRWLRGRRDLQPIFATVLGFLPFFNEIHVNLISMEHYRGDSRGIEVTLMDLLVLSLLFCFPPSRQGAPYRALRVVYLAAVLVSATQAESSLYALFGIWKLLRMYLLVAVVAMACRDTRAAPALIRGMTLGAIYQFFQVVYQRYGLHMYQTPGVFAHQNTLGMALNLVLPVCLARVLAQPRERLSIAALATGVATLIMSLSRGAMATFVVSSGLIYLLSAARRLTARKLAVAVLGVFFVSLLLLKAADSIARRFETAPEESGLARVEFNEAAARMLDSSPLGVGINQFSLELGHQPRGFSSGVVHNIYWLTAAELGYFGLAAFLALMAAPLLQALRYGWTTRGDIRGDELLGFGVGLLAMCAQGWLEWAWRQTPLSYLFWLVLALVGSTVRQLRAERRSVLKAAAALARARAGIATAPGNARPDG